MKTLDCTLNIAVCSNTRLMLEMGLCSPLEPECGTEGWRRTPQPYQPNSNHPSSESNNTQASNGSNNRNVASVMKAKRIKIQELSVVCTGDKDVDRHVKEDSSKKRAVQAPQKLWIRSALIPSQSSFITVR